MACLWLIFGLMTAFGVGTESWLTSQQKDEFSLAKLSIIVWNAIAATFGIFILLLRGTEDSLKFLAGYLLELSLSVDNLLVFMAIFSFFGLSDTAQRKALTYGISGAILMRIMFIVSGVALLNRFSWMTYIFGVLLIISALGISAPQKDEKKFKILSKVKAFFLVKNPDDALKFFTKEKGKTYVTPLFLCVVAAMLADVIFALDSIPAILAITRSSLLVFSSNILAVICLRSIYLCLAQLVKNFHLLKYGVSANLIFVGLKLIFSEIYHISTGISVTVIITSMTFSIIASRMIKPRKT